MDEQNIKTITNFSWQQKKNLAFEKRSLKMHAQHVYNKDASCIRTGR